MPFGCFGKRKKKDKGRAGSSGPGEAPNAVANDTVAKETVANEQAAPAVAEVKEEIVTVGRAQSLHAAAPQANSVQQRGANIQKSATLARYDFLRKSEYVNSADRWAALKQQYLAPKMSQSSQSSEQQQQQQQRQQRGPRTAQSLPRQFSPPSTVVSVVKFSQWFYERQIKEEEARQEAHEREEKTRPIAEPEEAIDIDLTDPEVQAAALKIQKGWGNRKFAKNNRDRQSDDATKPEETEETQPATEDQPEQQQQQQQQQEQQQSSSAEDELDLADPELNEAALKIQAGFKGMQARKEVKEMLQHQDNGEAAEENHKEVEEEEQQQQQQQQQAADSEELPQLDDPELAAAAVKIQAGFKGYKTRKEMGKLHNNEEREEAEEEAAS